jgi:protein-tyrosine-phosphatase
MPGLMTKWGDRDKWLRLVYLRVNILWLFRDELLGLDELRWLGGIIHDAFVAVELHAAAYETDGEAFNFCLTLIRERIEERVEAKGLDEELQRLRALTSEAQPCDHILAIFERLVKDVCRVYPRSSRRKVSLATEWINKHPSVSNTGGVPDLYHVAAQTRVSSRHSVVELQVHLDEFEAPSLLAIPALLTHELVCHAYASEDKSRSTSTWAEGVMDWVAAFFFDIWSPKLSLPYAAVRRHGGQLWDRRMFPTRGTGRAAADTVVEWLVTEPYVRGVRMAQQVVTRWAIDFNVTKHPLYKKDRLTSRMLLIHTDFELQDAFRAWYAGTEGVDALLLSLTP